VLENSTIYEELIDNLVLASDVCCLGLVPNESNTLIFQPPQCSPISRCAMRAPFASSLRIHAYQLRCFQHAALRRTPIQQAIEAAYYRGGTSRAVMIQPQHLPVERAKWPTIFRQLMGSGDPYGRQLDGMGAGISSLSKICLVEPHGKGVPKDAGAHGEEQELDIDYTFVGLGIENDEVDVAGNCGNMSSAIGPYAYNAGLLPPGVYEQRDGEVTVKFRNTNTGKLIDSTFEVVGGQAAVVGDYTIDGVTGNGSKIKLDFKHPYGSKTGKVLPTGNTVDDIEGYEVSCVDGANPAIFIRADDIGVDGTILPNDFNKLPDKLDLLERIRKSAAVAMGIAPREDLVPRTIPKIGLVSKSSKHMVLSGQTLAHTQMDLVVRFLSDTQPHRAIPLSAALTTAVAARIPGTIVQQLLAFSPVMGDAITIGHASGRLQVNATMEEKDPLTPLSATVYRTAKRLFEGKVYWTDMGGSSGDEMKYGSGGIHSLGLAFLLDSRG
jgi:2-methylaconitate cis-trans-isomerase PrpF